MPEPHATTDRGYDVRTTQPRSPKAIKNAANGWLIDFVANDTILLHITEVTTDLSLSGSTGQSVNTRDFYPHNFVQPFFSLSCQSAGQNALGDIAEFVHRAQRNSVRTGRVMRLAVPGAGLRNTARKMRGLRSGILVDGFVRAMPRHHRAHDPAPDYQFDFVISQMHDGIFKDTPYTAYKLAKWSDIVENIIQKNLVKPPKIDTETDESAYILHPPPLAPGANGQNRPT